MAGFDLFDDKRFANNHQSGSDYRILTTSAIIQGDDGLPGARRPDDHPLDADLRRLGGATASAPAPGSSTTPGASSKRWTFNVGLRYDKNDGVDSQGRAVVKDSALSPRVSATFDPKARRQLDPQRVVRATTWPPSPTAIGDGGSAGGQAATIDFAYLGPPVNTGNPSSPVPTERALKTLFDWFNANGGTNRPTRGAPVIPGLNTRIGDSLQSPNSREITLGVTRRLGAQGSVRVDGIYRRFHDFYITRIDSTTGQGAGPVRDELRPAASSRTTTTSSAATGA